MRIRLFLATAALFIFHSLNAQLTIEECYIKAENNYPLIRQYGLIEKSMEYNLANASKGYLPQFQFSARASYQSDVTQLPFDSEQLSAVIPGFSVPTLSKDQYSVKLDLNQNIWDGGTIKAQREIIRTQSEIDKNNLEVNLYSIRERVNQLYFGILLYDEMLIQNTLYQEELERNYTQVSAFMDNGLANQADLDAIEVEQVKATQNRIESIHNRKAYMEMLSALIGERVDENTRLVKPNVDSFYPTNIQRPEIKLYQAQFDNMEARKKEINAGLNPKFGLFFTGGYGRPGLNMLENKFAAYYIGGASISWNISNFYTRKNNLQTIDLNKTMIETQLDTFLFNTNLDITQRNNEIQKIRQLLHSDNDIIRLRQSVKNSAEAKLANGTISVLDLMKEIISEQTARQDKILHEIQLMQSIYNLKYVTNQ